MLRLSSLGFVVSFFLLSFGVTAFAQDESPTLTYDLGASTGQVNDVNYTEVNAGLNYHFMDYVAWRNALFGRFMTGQDSIYGIDTSIRGEVSFGDRQLGLSAFIGPGYRFVSKGDNAPFAEGGVILKAAGLMIGAGAKAIFNSVVHTGAEDDRQIFLILGGGGSI
jgi:hypothetical protein